MKDYELPNMGGSTISTKLTVQLIKELRTGIFSKVNKLPSEMDLSEKYKVSRSVIRDVMSNLEQEGFVERVRGTGTVINKNIVSLKSRLDMKYEYNEIIKNLGCQPNSDSVKLYTKSADESLAEKLKIEKGSEILVCEKRVLANNKPVIYSYNHLPIKIFSGKDFNLFDWSQPVFDILEKNFGLVVDTSITKLLASNGNAFLRDKLELDEEEALIFLEEVGYYKLSKPIMHTFGYYTNFFDFTMLRKKF